MDDNIFVDNYSVWHKRWSFVKSGIRMVGAGLAVFGIIDLTIFALFVIVAEVLGIVEELI